MATIVGIDLGTTNSCIAVMEGGEPTIITTAEGARTMPSVVAFSKNGERLVGQQAKAQALLNPERTISSIKRQMGSAHTVKIDRKKYTPQEISAMILSRLKRDAERFLGETVNEAVITVPAYFTDAQRQATKDAGEIAGFTVHRIINEPTAAALAYGLNREEPQKVMVYDLGGGTFDVSILDIASDVVEVLSTTGDSHLGGNDFDKRLADWLIAEFKKQSGIDITGDPAAMQRISQAAEAAKCELSSMTSTTVNLPFLAAAGGEPQHFECSVNRARFNELTHDLVATTMDCVKRALADAGLVPADISKVLMVGGSSRIPAVQEAVRDYMGTQPFSGINPDEAVALGAAIQGGVLAGEVKDLLLLDVTAHSLGIETVGNTYAKLIERNSTLPAERSEVFTTTAPFQTTVEVHVLQGENPFASANTTLGKFRLTGIKRAPAGTPQIEVTFSIDTNGLVHVSAKDLATGKQQGITITSTSNMPPRQLEAAKREEAKHARLEAAKDQ